MKKKISNEMINYILNYCKMNNNQRLKKNQR